MQGNIENALNQLLSPNPLQRTQANSFFNNQILGNPLFYNDLFTFYLSSTDNKQQRVVLVLIENIIKLNFASIIQNIEPFLSGFLNIVQNTQQDNALTKAQSEILIRIILKNSELTGSTEMLKKFYILYRTQEKLLPFCFFLYFTSIKITEKLPDFKNIIKEITPEILLKALENDDNEVNVLGCICFTKIYKFTDSANIPKEYQKHYESIYKIARKSEDLTEQYFDELWQNLKNIKKSRPLFDIAHNFLNSKKITSSNKITICLFLSMNAQFINKDELESIISNYFENCINFTLSPVDDVKTTILLHFAEIYQEKIYRIFKDNIIKYLSSDDISRENVGIEMLSGLFFAFPKQSVNDKSEILSMALKVAKKSNESILKMLNLLNNYLHDEQFNFTDSILISDYLIDVIMNHSNQENLLKIHEIFMNFYSSAIFYDKLIAIYDKVSTQTLGVYFSIIISLYSLECRINSDKYDDFLNYLIQNFNEYSQKYQMMKISINEEGEEIDELNDELIEYYQICLTLGGASNLLLFFAMHSTTKLGEYIEPCIENIVEICSEDKFLNIEYEKINEFSSYNVRTDFSYIISNFKDFGFDLIRPYFNQINNCQDSKQIDPIFCKYFGLENPKTETYLDDLEENYDILKEKQYNDLIEFVEFIMSTIDPMSKWLYKIPIEDIHKKFILFISNLFYASKNSSDIFNELSLVLLRYVKPKRVDYNKNNKWYWSNCLGISRRIFPIINKTLLCQRNNLDDVIFNGCFGGFVNVMLIQIYTRNEEGYEFLKNVIIKLYNDDIERYAIEMMSLFTKMITLQYYNDEEIDVMISIINELIKRDHFYQDPYPSLFVLLAEIIKIRPEVSSDYLEICIKKFNETTNNKYSTEKVYYANFLMRVFNSKLNSKMNERISPLIKDMMNVPFCKNKGSQLFMTEVKCFIEEQEEQTIKENIESILRYLINIISYEEQVQILCGMNETEITQIKKYFERMIHLYQQEHPSMTLESILHKYLPHQPTSIKYILSNYPQ